MQESGRRGEKLKKSSVSAENRGGRTEIPLLEVIAVNGACPIFKLVSQKFHQSRQI